MALPDHTTQSGTEYKNNLDEAARFGAWLYENKTTNYTVSELTDRGKVIGFSPGATTKLTCYLPSLSVWGVGIIALRKDSASGNAGVEVIPDAGDTIEGNSVFLLLNKDSQIVLAKLESGTDWKIVHRSNDIPYLEDPAIHGGYFDYVNSTTCRFDIFHNLGTTVPNTPYSGRVPVFDSNKTANPQWYYKDIEQIDFSSSGLVASTLYHAQVYLDPNYLLTGTLNTGAVDRTTGPFAYRSANKGFTLVGGVSPDAGPVFVRSGGIDLVKSWCNPIKRKRTIKGTGPSHNSNSWAHVTPNITILSWGGNEKIEMKSFGRARIGSNGVMGMGIDYNSVYLGSGSTSIPGYSEDGVGANTHFPCVIEDDLVLGGTLSRLTLNFASKDNTNQSLTQDFGSPALTVSYEG